MLKARSARSITSCPGIAALIFASSELIQLWSPSIDIDLKGNSAGVYPVITRRSIARCPSSSHLVERDRSRGKHAERREGAALEAAARMARVLQYRHLARERRID